MILHKIIDVITCLRSVPNEGKDQFSYEWRCEHFELMNLCKIWFKNIWTPLMRSIAQEKKNENKIYFNIVNILEPDWDWAAQCPFISSILRVSHPNWIQFSLIIVKTWAFDSFCNTLRALYTLFWLASFKWCSPGENLWHWHASATPCVFTGTRC
jgi:hypothetical protein